MTIISDIRDNAYNKLIHYALETSDAFLCVSLSNPIFSVDVDEQIELAQEFLPSFKPDRQTIEYLKKKEDESIADTQIFMNSCIPFIKELEIFLIKQRHNPIWPSTEIISSPSTYNINVYRTEDMAFNLLVRPKSYFSWRYPYYPEDLSFFRQNRCWLYSSSHEEYIEIFPSSISEYDMLVDMGIDFAEPYTPTPTDELYFEQY